MTMESNNCAICLEPLINSEQTVGTCVPCGHCFHEDCFEQYKSSRKNRRFFRHGVVVPCPMCNVKTTSFVKIFIKSARQETDKNNSNVITAATEVMPATELMPATEDESWSSIISSLLQDSEELEESDKKEHSCTKSEKSESDLLRTLAALSTPTISANKDEQTSKGEAKKRRRDSSSLTTMESFMMGRELKRYKQEYKQLYLKFIAKKQAWSELENVLSKKAQELQDKVTRTATELQQYKQESPKIHQSLEKAQDQNATLRKDIQAMETLVSLQHRRIGEMERSLASSRSENSNLKDTVQLQYARIQELLQSNHINNGTSTPPSRHEIDHLVHKIVQ